MIFMLETDYKMIAYVQSNSKTKMNSDWLIKLIVHNTQ